MEDPEAKVVLVQKMTCLNGCLLVVGFDASGGERELVRAPRRERPDRPEVQLKMRTRSADSWLRNYARIGCQLGLAKTSLAPKEEMRAPRECFVRKPFPAAFQALDGMCSVEVPLDLSISGVG